MLFNQADFRSSKLLSVLNMLGQFLEKGESSVALGPHQSSLPPTWLQVIARLPQPQQVPPLGAGVGTVISAQEVPVNT